MREKEGALLCQPNVERGFVKTNDAQACMLQVMVNESLSIQWGIKAVIIEYVRHAQM